MDAAWDDRSDRSMDGAGSWVWHRLGIGPRERVILAATVGRPIVTNGEFAAYLRSR